MSPEYGATCGFFPSTTRRSATCGSPAAPLGAHRARRGVLQGAHALARPEHEPTYSQVVELDLADGGAVARGAAPPAGPRPALGREGSFLASLETFGVDDGGATRRSRRRSPRATRLPSSTWRTTTCRTEGGPAARPRRGRARRAGAGRARRLTFALEHGAVVIAAITSCTNTSNPPVMVGAGLLARKAVERGLKRKPWVKTSLAPGSKVVTEYYDQRGPDAVPRGARLPHRRLRLHDLHRELGPATRADLRGGRARATSSSARRALGQPELRSAHPPEVKANYLASPPLVVAYALAGRMDVDLMNEPLGQDGDGDDVYLRDLWPTSTEIQDAITASVKARCSAAPTPTSSRATTTGAAAGPRGRAVHGETLDLRPPAAVLRGMSPEPGRVEDVDGARCLVMLGDSVTTDHISPAGAIKPHSPAGKYLIEHGVERKEFNSYGAARQPRGDGARHVRERAARNLMVARAARAPGRARAERRGDDDLRGVGAVPGRDAADRDRRPRVRLGLVARLGGEGPEPARGARPRSRSPTSESTARTS